MYFKEIILAKSKEKKNQKKKEEKEWAIAHNLMIRFYQAWHQCIYTLINH
jgi:hypothetical protein